MLGEKKENKPGTCTEFMLARQSRWAREKGGIQADVKKEIQASSKDSTGRAKALRQLEHSGLGVLQ